MFVVELETFVTCSSLVKLFLQTLLVNIHTVVHFIGLLVLSGQALLHFNTVLSTFLFKRQTTFSVV